MNGKGKGSIVRIGVMVRVAKRNSFVKLFQKVSFCMKWARGFFCAGAKIGESWVQFFLGASDFSSLFPVYNFYSKAEQSASMKLNKIRKRFKGSTESL